MTVLTLICCQLVLPSGGRLSDQERTGVCYLAFPDSNSGCMGDTQFFFRMMRTEGTRLSEVQTRWGRRDACPDGLPSAELSLGVAVNLWSRGTSIVSTITSI